MAVDMIPGDLVLRLNGIGNTANAWEVERGDTVTFGYNGITRTLLVLENDGEHLKGVDKARQGDFRSFLIRRIAGKITFAKSFVKPVPVTTVHFEMLPDPKPLFKLKTEDNKADLIFTNKNGDVLRVRVFGDGSANYMKNGVYMPLQTNTSESEPERMIKYIAEFLAE